MSLHDGQSHTHIRGSSGRLPRGRPLRAFSPAAVDQARSQPVAGAAAVFGVFLLSLRYGTRNITRSDTFVLIISLLAILVWWQLDEPLLAILMVSGIDFVGYIPTFRKTYEEPRSETRIFWLGSVIVNSLALAALVEYNLLTISYLVTLWIANLLVFLIATFRRTRA